MIYVGNPSMAEATRAGRTMSGSGRSWVSHYIKPQHPGPGLEVFPLPQAYTAAQEPHSVSAPHFHDEDQFQVVVAGGGTLGKHAIQPFVVHYANRHTGYGPIVAGDQGVTYFSLRQIPDKGAIHLKDEASRDKLERDAPKRQISTEPVRPSDEQQLRNRSEVSTEVLIEPEADGLAAWVMRVPPNATATPPAHPGGTGRFYIPIAGGMRVGNESVAKLVPVFVTHDESDFKVAADGAGLDVLVMQYPGGERVLQRKARYPEVPHSR